MHIPFCARKCGYCGFYSVPAATTASAPVLEAILCETAGRLADFPATIATLYVGGGTPTVLDGPNLQAFLLRLRAGLGAADLEEFTIEANPATVDSAKAAILADAGVTRVSLGAQSFHTSELRVLDRLHEPADVPAAVATLRRAGLADLNLDLVFGIPGQTFESWITSLRRTVELGPTHLACYGLTYEPDTPLTRQRQAGRVAPCDEGLEAEMYLAAIDLLAACGFEHYEVSNFARSGHRCRHNLIYWYNEPYLGLGPSAAGHISGRRYCNVGEVSEYVRRLNASLSPEEYAETLPAPAAALETLMLQMRLVPGLDLAWFASQTGYDLCSACAPAIARLAADGLVELTDTPPCPAHQLVPSTRPSPATQRVTPTQPNSTPSGQSSDSTRQSPTPSGQSPDSTRQSPTPSGQPSDATRQSPTFFGQSPVPSRLRLTRRGLLFADSVVAELAAAWLAEGRIPLPVTSTGEH